MRAAPRAFASRSRWPMSGIDGCANVDRRVERLEDVEGEVVLPLRERLEAELRAVELREGHGDQRSEGRGQRSEYNSNPRYLTDF